jgi:hypothetical protein
LQLPDEEVGAVDRAVAVSIPIGRARALVGPKVVLPHREVSGVDESVAVEVRIQVRNGDGGVL